MEKVCVIKKIGVIKEICEEKRLVRKKSYFVRRKINYNLENSVMKKIVI